MIGEMIEHESKLGHVSIVEGVRGWRIVWECSE